MSQRTTGVAAAVIAAAAVTIEFGSSVLVDGVADGETAIGWLPQLDTIGQTAVAYLYASRIVAFVLTFLVVAALGYWAGTRLDITREYGSLLGSLAVGGGVGYLAGLVLVGVLVGDYWPAPTDSLFGLGALLGLAVATAIHFALVGLAGAALAEFGFDPLSSRNDVPVSDTDAPADAK